MEFNSDKFSILTDAIMQIAVCEKSVENIYRLQSVS